jgi:hypothetical protein
MVPGQGTMDEWEFENEKKNVLKFLLTQAIKNKVAMLYLVSKEAGLNSSEHKS